MNKLLSTILILTIFSQAAFADCDWTKIKKNADNTYTYTEELHLCVGNLVEDNKNKDQQITDLTKAITLKDLAIKNSDDRANLWMETASKLEDRITKLDSMEKTNTFLTIGGTVLAVFLVGTVTARLTGR